MPSSPDRFVSRGIYRLSPCGAAAIEDGVGPWASAGVIHDLGNLIQIASSAINILSRHPHVQASQTLEPAMATARQSVAQAGALARETLAAARAEDCDHERPPAAPAPARPSSVAMNAASSGRAGDGLRLMSAPR